MLGRIGGEADKDMTALHVDRHDHEMDWENLYTCVANAQDRGC